MAKIKEKIEDFKPDEYLVDERGPTSERMNKVVSFERGDTGTITVRESTVDRAVRTNTLSEHQGRAAAKLYMHWYRASMAGTMGSSNMSRIFGGDNDFSRLAATEASEFHWNRLKAACAAVKEAVDGSGQRGSDAVRVLEYVVCRDMTFEQAGRKIGHSSRDWAEKGAIILARGGLNILIKEWGII
jgi:hypothetical protein